MSGGFPNFGVLDVLDERAAKDGFSDCSGRGARATNEGFPECGLTGRDGVPKLGLRSGLIGRTFVAFNDICGVGGLATLTPDAAVFSLATSSNVRLR